MKEELGRIYNLRSIASRVTGIFGNLNGVLKFTCQF